MKRLVVLVVMMLGGCGSQIAAEAAAARCPKVCTENDLALAGTIMVSDGDAERCLCEVRGDEAAEVEGAANATVAIAAARVEQR